MSRRGKRFSNLRAKYFEDQEGLEKELKKRSDTKKQMAPFQLLNTGYDGNDLLSTSAVPLRSVYC